MKNAYDEMPPLKVRRIRLRGGRPWLAICRLCINVDEYNTQPEALQAVLRHYRTNHQHLGAWHRDVA